MRRSLPNCFAAVLIVAAFCGPRPGVAATRDWNAFSDNWSTATNWTPAGVPAASDDVNIAFGDGVARTVAYDYAGPPTTLNSLALGLSGSLSRTVELAMANNALTATTESIGSSGRGTFTQTGGTNTANVLRVGAIPAGEGFYTMSGAGALATVNTLQVGSIAGSAGTLVVAAGATMNATTSSLGYFGGCCGSGPSVGAATVDGAGSTWNTSLFFEVGRDGVGSVAITDGGVVNSFVSYVGRYFNSQGRVTVSGEGSLWRAQGNGYLAGDVDGPHGSTALLEVLPGGTAYFNNSLTLWSPAVVNLAGGTIRFNGYQRSPGAQFNYTSGAIQLAGDRVVGADPAIAELFGAAPNVGFGKQLVVEGRATLQRPLTIDGGSFAAGEIQNVQFLDLRRGGLRFTNQLVTVGAGGTFAALDVAENTSVGATLGILNQGVVKGDGEIGGPFLNAAGGELRAQAGRSLLLSGVGNVNDGAVKLVGGELEFAADLTNNPGGVISGNGSLAVAGGLANRGTLSFAGTANVVGDVDNQPGGRILSSGGDATVFFDDVVNNGEIRTSANSFTVFFGAVSGNGSFTGAGTVNFEGDLAPGNSPASVAFAGDVGFGPDATLVLELGGATAGSEYDQLRVGGDLALDGSLVVALLSGFVPSAGQSFDLLDWGTVRGTFSTLTLPSLGPGLLWDASQFYSQGVLSVASALTADFNEDGTVDVEDLGAWKQNFGVLAGAARAQGDADANGAVDGADLLAWQRQLNPAAATALAALLPEPSTLLAASWLASLVAVAGRRRTCRVMA